MTDWTTVVSRALRSITLVDAEKQSDHDLLERFAAHGDQVAFTVLVKRHGPMVFGVCRRLLAQSQDAEDAAQAVFVLLAQKAKHTSWHLSIANWLYATARNIAGKAHLSAQRRARREKRAIRVESVSPLDAMTGRELLVTLDEELDRLPPRYREPLVLCYLEGLTRDEAASRLGVPETTLKSQLERGRKKLAQALTARGCTLSSLLLLATSGAGSASVPLVDSILSAVAGPPTEAVANLIQGVAMKGIFTKTNLLALLGVGTVLIGLGLASIPPTSAQPQKGEAPQPVEKKIDEPKVEPNANAPVATIGSKNFRADKLIGDARYSADGKRIVGHAAMTLYVWDAKDGTLVRKIDTQLGHLTDPGYVTYGETAFGFAVHPNANLVAWSGIRDGKTYLQIWDYEKGERLAECETAQRILKALAWSRDGKHLFERTRADKENVWRLVVRDANLKAIRTRKLPEQASPNGQPLLVHPDGKHLLLWQSKDAMDVLDIETGATVRTIPFKPDDASELGLSPDGKTLLMTGFNQISLFDFESGNKLREIPVHSAWPKPRPLFSKDGKTVYLWDHHPMAYEVETAKRKWKAVSPTYFGAGIKANDLSPDQETILAHYASALILIDAKTGIEREVSQSTSGNLYLFWSPDGKTLFTRGRGYGQSRTFTAWDVSTGKQLYHVQPGQAFAGDDWQMTPDLFFLDGGKEILVCLEKSGEHGSTAFKELLVLDTATGQFKRKLGDELGEPFREMHPIAANRDGSQVVMQSYPMKSNTPQHPTVLWEPLKNHKAKEWICVGRRSDSPRHYEPYNVFSETADPTLSLNQPDRAVEPARLLLYSLFDGKQVRRLQSDFTLLNAYSVRGGFVLTGGYNAGWKKHEGGSRFLPTSAHVYELWELSTGEKLRLFEVPDGVEVVLGPEANYLIRTRDERSFEIHEPFVLNGAVLKVTTPCRASSFEFSADGTRVAASMSDATVMIWDTTPWAKQIDVELRKKLPQDLTPLWDDLAGNAAAKLRASRLLGLAGERTVALLDEKIAVKRVPDEASVRKLIRDLDSVEFAIRQKADRQLRNLAGQIESSLRAVLKDNPSAEAKQRIEEIVKGIESGKRSSEENREVRAVELLKSIGSKEAKALLAKWSKGDPNAVLTKAAKE